MPYIRPLSSLAFLMAATIGVPFSHSLIISRNSSGGSWRSANRMPTASPWACRNACIGERKWPKFRALTITFTLLSAAAISRRIDTVASCDALSMKMCS